MRNPQNSATIPEALWRIGCSLAKVLDSLVAVFLTWLGLGGTLFLLAWAVGLVRVCTS